MARPFRLILFLVVTACAAPAAVHAQPPKRPTPKRPPATAPAAPVATPAPDAPTYQAAGRRDPFLSPLGARGEARPVARKVDGPAGMATADISVRGVMQSRGAMIAMILGPDRRTYIVHQGDKLADGTIKSITAQGLVIDQQVNDPLSTVKRREITKPLRSVETAKE